MFKPVGLNVAQSYQMRQIGALGAEYALHMEQHRKKKHMETHGNMQMGVSTLIATFVATHMTKCLARDIGMATFTSTSMAIGAGMDTCVAT